ncbi:hypothetical protein G6F22_021125 [Rhizopus arrhizus]|nr:hypothetical protein G6F22_021125 [Rhizopus arrhizus]
MAMITSQGQRLAHLEALTKENQDLRADLEAAHRRIKELENLNTTLPAAPKTAATNKPAGSEASKWKSPPTPVPTPAPTTSSFASAARKGMRSTQPSKPKATTRTVVFTLIISLMSCEITQKILKINNLTVYHI